MHQNCKLLKLTPQIKCFKLSQTFRRFEHVGVLEPTANSDSPHHSHLVDSFGRLHTYLRISLTERCNLRCKYCMPEEGVPLNPSAKLLTSEEILTLVKLFARLGVNKVRLTGGEPTIRKDLLNITRGIASIPGISQLGMTSNGVILGRQLLALRESGLNRLNISLDSLDDKKFSEITRRNAFSRVMNLIHLTEPLFNPLKINCVVMRGFNDDEVVDFVDLTEKMSIDVRFIEFMPFGGNDFDEQKMVPYRELLTKIFAKYGSQVLKLENEPNHTSKSYKIQSFKGQFGFITSMSEHFCGTCNRLRITADGNLKVCLHGNTEISLRDHLRAGATDEQLIELIAGAVQRKKAQHADEESSDGFDRWMTASEFQKPKPATESHFSSKNIFPSNLKIFLRPAPRSIQCRLYSTNNDNEKPCKYIEHLSHLNSRGKARMVDVSGKRPSIRIALARAIVQFPPEFFKEPQISSPKGDLYGVSRVAGIQAAKKTSELIPLCHQIALSNVKIAFVAKTEHKQIEVFCRSKTFSSSTGVEMEALVGCSIAALTIYDMCKALGYGIRIEGVELVGKSGGKRDFGEVDLPDFDDDEGAK